MADLPVYLQIISLADKYGKILLKITGNQAKHPAAFVYALP